MAAPDAPVEADAPGDGHSGRVGTFASLRVRNYRWYFGGQVFSTTGTWMQRIAQDWLVLELTNSPFAVGVTTVLQFTPLLLFGLWGGVLADRYSKRLLLIYSQCTMAVFSAVLATLTLTGHIRVEHIYVMAFAVGVATAVNNPARQSFVNEMVGGSLLRNAIALNAGIFQLSRLVGPALAGVVITAVGSGYAFAINAVCYVPSVVALLVLRRSELFLSDRVPRQRGQLVAGLRYVASAPELRWRMLVVVFTGVFGMNLSVILVAYAGVVFKSGPDLYGLLNSAVAVGAVAGAVVAARRRGSRLRALLVSLAALGLFNVATGLTPWFVPFVVLLVLQGFSSVTLMTMVNTGIQMAAASEFRGRVMSLHGLVMFGGVPFGALLLGWVTEHWGAPSALVVSGAALVIAAVALAWLVSRGSGVPLRAAVRTGLRQSLRGSAKRNSGV